MGGDEVESEVQDSTIKKFCSKRKEIVHQPQSNAESKERSLNGRDLCFFLK